MLQDTCKADYSKHWEDAVKRLVQKYKDPKAFWLGIKPLQGNSGHPSPWLRTVGDTSYNDNSIVQKFRDLWMPLFTITLEDNTSFNPDVTPATPYPHHTSHSHRLQLPDASPLSVKENWGSWTMISNKQNKTHLTWKAAVQLPISPSSLYHLQLSLIGNFSPSQGGNPRQCFIAITINYFTSDMLHLITRTALIFSMQTTPLR